MIAEALLNHKSGVIRGVAAIYNKYDYAAEKRSAMQAWARYVESLVSDEPDSNIVPIRQGAL
jgi:hypothetical protein